MVAVSDVKMASFSIFTDGFWYFFIPADFFIIFFIVYPPCLLNITIIKRMSTLRFRCYTTPIMIRHTLSVIIPTRKRAATLQNTLAALSLQNPKPHQVIIVNNCVDKQTDSVVAAFTSSLPIQYYSELRTGPSFARNTGFRHATGTVIAFLDDDCVPAKHWVRDILATYKTNAYPDRIFQGYCSHVFPTTNILTDMFYFRNTYNIPKNIGARRGNTLRVIDSTLAGCCFMNRNVLDKMPYVFDTELFPFIGEERDFSVRAQLAGAVIMQHPKVAVVHYKQAARNPLKSFQNAFMVGRAYKIMQLKYLPYSPARQLFGAEVKSLPHEPHIMVWHHIRLFWELYHNKSVFWKCAAFSFETVRSLFSLFGMAYTQIVFGGRFNDLKTTHSSTTRRDTLLPTSG